MFQSERDSAIVANQGLDKVVQELTTQIRVDRAFSEGDATNFQLALSNIQDNLEKEKPGFKRQISGI